MTATERLRAMLDERGVKYKANDIMGLSETCWGGTYAFQLSPDSALMMRVTPEQAVAATLGPGTCHPEEQYLDSHSDLTVTVCSECGVPTDDLEDCNFCPNCGRKVVP